MLARDLTDEARAAAQSAWDREGGLARRGRGTLYRSHALNVMFTLAPPWLPYLAMGPIAFVCLWNAFDSLPLALFTMLFTAGALIWTLVEYAMHRFLFHAPAKSEPARVILLLVHGHHHVWPDDRRRIAATPLQFGSLSLLLFWIFSLVLSPPQADAAFGGAMVSYLVYEALHYHAHHGRSQSGVLGALRRHHMAHHHQSPRSRWGIGTPLWDVVFHTNGEGE